MSRGTALALSAMIGICAVAGSSLQDLHGLQAAHARQVDVHQDHFGLVDARDLDPEPGRRAALEQAQVGDGARSAAPPVRGWPGLSSTYSTACRGTPAVRPAGGSAPNARCRARMRGRELRERARQAELDPEDAAFADRAVRPRCCRPSFPPGAWSPPGRLPVPSSRAGSPGPCRLNGWNSCASCSRGEAGAGVAHADAHHVGPGSAVHSTATAAGRACCT